MTRTNWRIALCAFALLLLLPVYGRCQPTQAAADQTSSPACPDQPPGVYVLGSNGWHPLKDSAPSKMKAKHGFLTSMTDGALPARMVVEYAGPHAAVQVHAARPTVCVSHLMTSSPAMIVRLKSKKKDRELDSGTVRAIPFANDSRQGHAEASSIVPTTTKKPEYGIVLVEPQADLAPGEYAVMFGPTNLAVFDFGVAAAR